MRVDQSITLVSERVHFVRRVSELAADFRYELQRVDQELVGVRQSYALLAQLDDLEAYEDMDEKMDEFKVCFRRYCTLKAQHCTVIL